MTNYKELDALNRKEQIEEVKTIINDYSQRDKHLTLAINGGWGCGKTFFLKELTEEYDEDTFVFYYDAWSNNYYEEPLIGILDVIRKQLNSINCKTNIVRAIACDALNIITNFFDAMIETKIGIRPINAVKNVKEYIEKKKKESSLGNDFNPYSLIDNAKNTTIKAINKLNSKGNKVIILIDELDRCDPRYAIKILERIHHVSLNTKSCVLVAIDGEQIEKSICSIYSFSDEKMSKRYLRKIVDMSIDIGNGEFDLEKRKDVFGELEKLYSDYEAGSSLESQIVDFEYCLFQDLEIRKIERLVGFTVTSHKLFFGEEKCSPIIMCGELLLGWASLHTKNKKEILSEMAQEYDDKNDCMLYNYIKKNLKGYLNANQSAFGYPSLDITDAYSYLFYLIKAAKREKINCQFPHYDGGKLLRQSNKITDDYLKIIIKTNI